MWISVAGIHHRSVRLRVQIFCLSRKRQQQPINVYIQPVPSLVRIWWFLWGVQLMMCFRFHLFLSTFFFVCIECTSTDKQTKRSGCNINDARAPNARHVPSEEKLHTMLPPKSWRWRQSLRLQNFNLIYMLHSLQMLRYLCATWQKNGTRVQLVLGAVSRRRDTNA